jgi:predicted aconitase with swiveling domain
MTGFNGVGTRVILDAIQNRTLDESILNERAEKMLELIAKSIPTL